MPGRRINRTQVAKYMEYRKELEQEAAAAKVGISVRTARRIERAGGLPSKAEARQWRTRPDPLSRWWEAEIVPLLEAAPALNAVTILEELQRRYPAEASPALLQVAYRRQTDRVHEPIPRSPPWRRKVGRTTRGRVVAPGPSPRARTLVGQRAAACRPAR